MISTPAIETSELTKVYRNGLFGRPFEALKGVTLRVERGEIFGLLGPNGAGKTTIIKVLLGIVRRTRGHATLLGRPAGDRLSRLRIGYLPENLRIPAHHTAWSALQYYGALSGVTATEVRKRRQELLELVGLADRTRESVKKFSKGMLQRLGLAQALLHDPELLILDEPTDGLDPLGRSQIRSLLARLKREGKTVFLNSHILQEVELVCDRVAILDRGELRGVGTVEELAPQQFAGIELDLVLIGAEPDIRAGLGDRGVLHWQPLENGHVRLLLRLGDQAAVDQCVDDLRAAQVSIETLVRRRVTLEDAFLRILQQGASAT